MPIYEFLCEDCGPFEERRSFEEAGNPAVCPECGTAARRVYSVSRLKTILPALSNAMNRAEKSAHEPEVVRQPAGGTWPGKKYQPSHRRSCGH